MGSPEPSDQPLLGGCRAFRLESDVVGDTFTVFTGRCGVSSERPPQLVLYTTDGNAHLGLATDVIRLGALAALFPPTLVVAIGYPEPTKAQQTRMRDLTPSEDPSREAAEMGGADAFAECIATEIVPWIEETYRPRGRRAYAGESLGGLFGAYVALTRPGLFDDFVLGSPSVWWDHDRLLGTEAAGSVAETRVFIGVGAEERSEGKTRLSTRVPAFGEMLTALGESEDRTDMVVGALRLADRFDELGMRVRSQVFADEHHTTVFPVVLSRGLRWLYGDLAEPTV